MNIVVETSDIAVFFAIVAMWAALHVDILCEEMDDAGNCEAWYAAIDTHRERIKPIQGQSELPYTC